jgi:hypothetical protein
LAIMCLANALEMFLRCRPKILTIPFIEKDGPT